MHLNQPTAKPTVAHTSELNLLQLMHLNHIPAPIDASLLAMPPPILDSEGGGGGLAPHGIAGGSSSGGGQLGTRRGYNGQGPEVLSFLALLVQKYKY